METIIELVGIYDASGSITGKLRYAFNKLVLKRTCHLCDISHLLHREKKEFEECRKSLPVPLIMLHLDQLETELYDFIQDRAPCVVARTKKGFSMVLDSRELALCDASVNHFHHSLKQKILSMF